MRSCRRGILFGVYCAFDQSLTRVTSAFPPTLFALCLRVCVLRSPPLLLFGSQPALACLWPGANEDSCRHGLFVAQQWDAHDRLASQPK